MRLIKGNVFEHPDLDIVDVSYNCHTQVKRVYVSQCDKCGKFKKLTVK